MVHEGNQFISVCVIIPFSIIVLIHYNLDRSIHQINKLCDHFTLCYIVTLRKIIKFCLNSHTLFVQAHSNYPKIEFKQFIIFLFMNVFFYCMIKVL